MQHFDRTQFQNAVSAAVSRCQVINEQDAWHFITKGYLIVRNAFPKQFGADVRQHAWNELEQDHGLDRDNPATWRDSPTPGIGIRGYIRTNGGNIRLNLKQDAPRAFLAQTDAVGGPERLPDGGENLVWSDAAVCNLGSPQDPPDIPSPRLPTWHKDGWHFRHFLGSPEQGLLTVPLFSDILPGSGGTQIASDSLAPVARLLLSHPEGLHPDSVQGGGYLIPGLIEQCSQFEELIGEVGDLVILHPYVLHRPCTNPSDRPRFIANAALVLNEPMQFNRKSHDPYSLTELAVLHALQQNSVDYRMTRSLKAFLPSPFRKEAEANKQQERLEAEMLQQARLGTVTPNWGPDCGYASNRHMSAD